MKTIGGGGCSEQHALQSVNVYLSVNVILKFTLFNAVALSQVRIQTSIQWNLSIVDTIGTQLALLYRKVSLIQR